MWVPLHVADTPHGLELGAAGVVLVEVPVFALLQQELAATVSRELVSHPAGVKQETCQGAVLVCISTFEITFSVCRTHVPQLTITLPTLSVKP